VEHGKVPESSALLVLPLNLTVRLDPSFVKIAVDIVGAGRGS
jgi:hypothetical protein